MAWHEMGKKTKQKTNLIVGGKMEPKFGTQTPYFLVTCGTLSYINMPKFLRALISNNTMVGAS